MTVHVDKPKGFPRSVTTGAIHGSRKVHASPAGRPDIRVPYREIPLTGPGEAPVRVYDPSGAYTDADAAIDLGQGLPPVREKWIAARGYAAVEPRPVKPEYNGHAAPDRLVEPCPAVRTIRRAAAGEMVTQYEFARAGIVTEEMIYVAHRENLCREAMPDGADARIADGESFGAAIPSFITPEPNAMKSPADAWSSRPTSIICPNASNRCAIGVAGPCAKSTPTSATPPYGRPAPSRMNSRSCTPPSTSGSDTVMDLSTGGNIDNIRSSILIDASPVPIGTVPIYQIIQERKRIRRT